MQLETDIVALAAVKRVKAVEVAKAVRKRLKCKCSPEYAARIRDTRGPIWKHGTRLQKAIAEEWAERVGSTVEVLWPDTTEAA